MLVFTFRMLMKAVSLFLSLFFSLSRWCFDDQVSSCPSEPITVLVLLLPPLQTGVLYHAVVFRYPCPVASLPFSDPVYVCVVIFASRYRQRVPTEHSGQETRTLILVSLLRQPWGVTTLPSSHLFQCRLQGERERSISYRPKWATCTSKTRCKKNYSCDLETNTYSA